MKTIPPFAITRILLAGLAAGLLSGCSASFVSNRAGLEQIPVGNIQGAVHGGQAPISGAHIYLYAAGAGGYGMSATSLIRSADNTYEDGNGNYYVETDANGNFAMGGDYTCTAGTQVYMVAVNSTAGLAGTLNNTANVQMAGLGQCPTAGSLAAQVPYLVISEVTTVAFAYSVGGFGSNAYKILSNAADPAASPAAIAETTANADRENTAWVANDCANATSAWSSTSGTWLARMACASAANSMGKTDGMQLLGLATPTATPFYGGVTLTAGTRKTQATTTTNGNLGSKL